MRLEIFGAKPSPCIQVLSTPRKNHSAIWVYPGLHQTLREVPISTIETIPAGVIHNYTRTRGILDTIVAPKINVSNRRVASNFQPVDWIGTFLWRHVGVSSSTPQLRYSFVSHWAVHNLHCFLAQPQDWVQYPEERNSAAYSASAPKSRSVHSKYMSMSSESLADAGSGPSSIWTRLLHIGLSSITEIQLSEWFGSQGGSSVHDQRIYVYSIQRYFL